MGNDEQSPRVVVETHELPPEERCCPKCSGEMEEKPGEAEVSEESVILAGERVLRRHVRMQYRCSCGIWIHAPRPNS